MPEITCRPVSEVDFDDFTAALNAAYADYYVHIEMTPGSLRSMMSRDGIEMDHSVVALDGETIVGTGLLGVRGARGWIGGMGVVPARRRQGIGRQMMHYLMDRARAIRLSTLQLEVIEANHGAHALYENMGFSSVRHLLILARHPVQPPARLSDYQVERFTADEMLDYYEIFHDVANCWQRDLPSLRALSGQTVGWGAFDGSDQLIGYAVGWADTFELRLLDLAVSPSAARPGAAQALLAVLHQSYPEAQGSIYNVGDDDPVLPAYEAAGYTVSFRQIEMRLAL